MAIFGIIKKSMLSPFKGKQETKLFSQQKIENKNACPLETNARAARNLKKYNAKEKRGYDLEPWKSPTLYPNEAAQSRYGN